MVTTARRSARYMMVGARPRKIPGGVFAGVVLKKILQGGGGGPGPDPFWAHDGGGVGEISEGGRAAEKFPLGGAPHFRAPPTAPAGVVRFPAAPQNIESRH